jgi:hypothetical protein
MLRWFLSGRGRPQTQSLSTFGWRSKFAWPVGKMARPRGANLRIDTLTAITLVLALTGCSAGNAKQSEGGTGG